MVKIGYMSEVLFTDLVLVTEFKEDLEKEFQAEMQKLGSKGLQENLFLILHNQCKLCNSAQMVSWDIKQVDNGRELWLMYGSSQQ